MALIQTVHLSMANFKSAPVVPAVQNDTDRQIKMVIDDFDLTAGLTGKITFVRSDGTHYEENATLDTATNSFTADIDQALTQPGRTMVQLKVTDTLTVSTFSFVIFVEEDTSGAVTPQEGIDLVTAVSAAEDAADRAESAAETLDADAIWDAIDGLEDCFDSEVHTPINLLDFDAVTFGYYMTNTGAVAENSGYWYSDYIPVEEGKTYSFQRGNKTVTQGRTLLWVRWISLYDSEKTLMSGGVSNWAQTYTIPDGVKFIILSSSELISPKADKNPAMVLGTELVDYSDYFAPYATKILKSECNNDPHIIDLINQQISLENGKAILTAETASLAANTNLICGFTSGNKKNEYIELTANFSAFGTLTIAHGKDSYGGGYIEISDTKISVYNYNGTLLEEFTHGLTVSDFINVIVYTKNDNSCRSSITIMSAGGDYTADTTRFYSSRGAVLCSATFAMTNVEMRYTVNDAKEDVWIFGDSYISLGDPNRWAAQMVLSGHKNALLCGFGGAMAEDGIVYFRNFTSVCTPKYIVWALGMNNADSGAVNANWKSCTDEVISTCAEKGITPILATIPNVPNVDNTYKNAYVKSSGCRYVDFAKSVNAESAGATWYSGMLSNDNTHPTALGAKALMRRFLLDVPEVLYAEE